MLQVRTFLTFLLVIAAGVTTLGVAGEVEILRDNWGIPHIYADTIYDASFALGYAHAEDGVADILPMVMAARGCSAMIQGGNAAIEEDVRVRTFGLPEFCDAIYARQSADARARCDGYAAGIEQFLVTHPDRRPAWFDTMTGRDVTALHKWFQFRQELGEAQKDLAPGKQDRGGDLSDGTGGLSNMWAVGPSKTSQGETMLLSDPHLPWSGMTKWYEAQITIDDRWTYGAGFLGFAGISIGFTPDLAWGSTNNGADTGDVYREQLNPDNLNEYRYAGAWKTITSEEITVPLPGGKSARRTIRRTHHGPIIRENERKHEVYTVRLAGLESVNLAELGGKYIAARNVGEFVEAHAAGHDFKWNRMVADRHGGLAYLFLSGGHRRSDQFNWGRPVDGSIAETEWGPPLTLADLPTIINPSSGLLINCNNSPYTSSPDSPLKADDFPRNLAGQGEILDPSTRAHRATELLTAEDKIDFDDMQRISMDVQTLTAKPFVDAITGAYSKLRDGAATSDQDVVRAIEILKSWDGQATVENRALPILTCFIDVAGSTDGALAGSPDEMIARLAKALALMQERWGDADVTWGSVHAIRRGGNVWPLSGAGSNRSAIPFTTLYMTGSKKFDGKLYEGDSGSSWMMVVKYDAGTVAARTIVPWGNSPDPASPHYADQSPLYSARQYKQALLTRAEVLANLESRVLLTAGK